VFQPEEKLLQHKTFLAKKVCYSFGKHKLLSYCDSISRQYGKNNSQSINMQCQNIPTYFLRFGDYKKMSVKSSVRYSTTMKILSFIFAVTLTVSLSRIPGVSARANQEKISSNGVMVTEKTSSPFEICIDDSDCQKLGQGDKFACFKFLCYPWQDDSAIAPKDRIPLCRKTSDCGDNKKCYRHTDRRRVSKGLCFEELTDCGIEEDDGKCPKDKGCCGSLCCEKKFFDKYSQLPCMNNKGCEDLGLGKYCCPKGNGDDNVCCNTDPNPPPSTAVPVTGGKGKATSIQATAFTSSLISTLFFFWMM